MSSAGKLLIVEAHPVQYRAPVFQRLQELRPDSFVVLYAATSSATNGQYDIDFGKSFSWDIDLLSGYRHHVLDTERVDAFAEFFRFGSRGIYSFLERNRPSSILLHSFAHQYSVTIYLCALLLGIPLWVRMETQDKAYDRGPIKSLIRGPVYKALYFPVARAYSIGALNREHLLSHGVPLARQFPAGYCTSDPLARLSAMEKAKYRLSTRTRFDVSPDDLVVGFCGKLIEKKDPLLILSAVDKIRRGIKRRLVIWVVGSGALEDSMKSQAKICEAKGDARALFHGFVNQSQLFHHYLAMDVLVLPSKRMGETWGLVVNEALQAGCGVVVSDAVGCGEDFKTLERFRIIPVGDARRLAEAVVQLSLFNRDFNWARPYLSNYSVESAAAALAAGIDEMEKRQDHCQLPTSVRKQNY
jgi:glycosyltransferase involved in cell wall biosynthesis